MVTRAKWAHVYQLYRWATMQLGNLFSLLTWMIQICGRAGASVEDVCVRLKSTRHMFSAMKATPVRNASDEACSGDTIGTGFLRSACTIDSTKYYNPPLHALRRKLPRGTSAHSKEFQTQGHLEVSVVRN